MPLPNDRYARNSLPVWDGCVAYFPDCWAEIAKVSVLGNKQHALGAKLHFARDVSTDHANKVMRHMLDHEAGNVMDSDGTFHLAKAAWRCLAALQVAIEAQTGIIARSAVNSADLPKEITNGSFNVQTAQGTPTEGFCTSIDQEGWQRGLSDTGRKPRPERPFPSQPERDFSPEGGSAGKGSQ